MLKTAAGSVVRLGVLGVLFLATGCSPLDDAMVAIFGHSMRDQVSFDPYENNPVNAPSEAVPFAAGNLAARPGEVNIGQPEGLEDVPPPFTQVDILDQAEVVIGLENPVEPTEESLARGEELFVRFCAPCHGPNGAGATGYIILAGYPPYSLTLPQVAEYSDGYLYGMIRMGRGNMPAYGHRISHFDRWNVVNYLRVLQGVAVPPSQAAGGENQTEGASPQSGGASSN
jgi:mono/diheme cytochrome c family protein